MINYSLWSLRQFTLWLNQSKTWTVVFRCCKNHTIQISFRHLRQQHLAYCVPERLQFFYSNNLKKKKVIFLKNAPISVWNYHCVFARHFCTVTNVITVHSQHHILRRYVPSHTDVMADMSEHVRLWGDKPKILWYLNWPENGATYRITFRPLNHLPDFKTGRKKKGSPFLSGDTCVYSLQV